MRVRLSTLTALTAAITAGLLLFQTSQNVQQADGKLRATRQALAKEEDAMRVLETEWDYLNRPDRIEELTRQHLKMQAPLPAALVRDSAQALTPNRMPPAIPAVAKAAAPPAPTTAVPIPSPAANDAHRQFDDLLNTLTQDGGQR